MLYTEADRSQATAERTKRRWIVVLPAVLLLLAAIASFVWFRLHRDVSGWIWTGLLTVAGGAYYLFFNGVYLHPVALYKKHVDYMLDGNKRETIGILKDITDEVLDHDGLDCRMITVNIGDKNASEDDRTYYLDARVSIPAQLKPGDRVHVLSNDRMVAALDPEGKEENK